MAAHNSVTKLQKNRQQLTLPRCFYFASCLFIRPSLSFPAGKGAVKIPDKLVSYMQLNCCKCEKHLSKYGVFLK